MKKTIAERVHENQSALMAMQSHSELREWAKAQGMDNATSFSNFKKALAQIGIDYEGLRGQAHEAQAAEIEASCTHTITLFTDAKASACRYAICGADGQPLWHGRFFDNDNAGEQSQAELESAKKAVWLADKIRESVGSEACKLILKVDAQWLTYQDHAGQKGFVLSTLARKYGIVLEVVWIPGTENPADKYTVCSGYKKWQDNNLAALASKI